MKGIRRFRKLRHETFAVEWYEGIVSVGIVITED